MLNKIGIRFGDSKQEVKIVSYTVLTLKKEKTIYIDCKKMDKLSEKFAQFNALEINMFLLKSGNHNGVVVKSSASSERMLQLDRFDSCVCAKKLQIKLLQN